MKWKKIIGWTVLVAFALVGILLGTAYAVVHTKAFNQWALAQVTEQARQTTGARVEIQSMAIDWRSLDVDFYGLALYGNGPDSAPVLLRADHLRVGLKIVSLLRRKFDLAEIVLDRPVVHLLVDARGNSNMPRAASGSKSPNSPTVFDMAIGHVAINSGQIYYNDEELPLSAEAHDFHAQVNYSALGGEYKGSLGYAQGHVRVKDFSPVEHGVELQFTANRTGLTAEQLLLTTGKSHVTAHAHLSDYANLAIEGNYEAVVFTEELARVLKRSSIPIGQVTATGNLRYRNISNRPFLDATYIDGHFGSLQLALTVGRVSTPLKSIQGTYSLDQGNLHVQNLQAELFHGRVSANMEMLNLTGNSKSRLEAMLKNVSLSDVSNALPAGSYQRVRIVGSANSNVQATWSDGFQHLIAHSHTVISSRAQTSKGSSAIPLDGIVDVNYDGARDVASFGQSYLRTGSTQISLSGTLSRQSSLTVEANTSNLHEVADLVTEIQAATGNSVGTFSPYDLQGSARFNGQVRGSVSSPDIEGQLTANEIQIDGSRWRILRTSLDVSPSRVVLQDGFLANSRQGQLSFRGRAGLEEWSLKPSGPISLHVAATSLSIADFERLANAQYPVSGILSGNINLEGSRQDPNGQGSLQLTKASAWNEPISDLTVKFSGANHAIRSTAQLQVPAGAVSANLTYSLSTGKYEANVSASGLKLEQVHAIQTRDLGLSGILTASVDGQGTLDDPQFTAHLQIPQLQIRDQAISNLQGQVNVAHERASFAITSNVAQGSAEAKGDVALTGEYQTTASLDVRGFPVGTLLASYISGGQPDLQGQTEIHATVNGPLKAPAQLEAHVEIPSLNLSYKTAQIALVHPLKIDYRDGVATFQQTEMKGNGTDITLQGVLPVKNIAESSVTANGTVDLSLLQGFTNGLKSSGRIDINLSSGGRLSAQTMHGQVRIVNARLSADAIPVGFEAVNGQIQVSGNRLDISQFSGKAGGGEITAGGFVIYGSQPNFNLNVDATDVRVRYPEGLRSVLNGNLRLSGTPQDSTLSGRVILDRLSFTQQFDLSNFIGQFAAESPSASSSSFEDNLKLNVALQSADQLRVANSKVSTTGAASLRLSGTLSDPVVLGRVTLTGGDVFFLGKRYEVQSGTIEFSNPVRTEPILNLYVTTIVQQYNITLNFVGPVDRMRTNYTSVPSLPPADIINLIALGKTAEESAASNTPASLGAESVLAQGVSSQVSSKVEKLTGISQLTLDPLAGNGQQDPGAQVAIQERVTGNLIVTFSTNVTTTQSTTVQVQYQTSRQTSISVLRDQNGGFAVDVRLHKTF